MKKRTSHMLYNVRCSQLGRKDLDYLSVLLSARPARLTFRFCDSDSYSVGMPGSGWPRRLPTVRHRRRPRRGQVQTGFPVQVSRLRARTICRLSP